jgi:phosphohistidine phosphatase
MTDLYILRHGIAEPRQQGLADEDRQLTKKGREKLGRVLSRARAAKVSPKLILTSPLARALQTAEAAAKALGPELKVIASEALVPGAAPEAVWDEVRKHASKGPLMLVGHEPLLGETVSFLAGVEAGIVNLKKGALACMNIDPKRKRPEGALEWLLTPKVCRGVDG